MGTYDNIQIPVVDTPISQSLYGVRVRDAIIDLDRRLLLVESTLSNYAFKSGNTTRISTTTQADDPDLKLYCAANSRYFIEFFITCAALAVEDIQTTWAVPAGSTSTNRRVLGPSSVALNAQADDITVRMGTHGYATTVGYNGVRNGTNQFQVQEIGLITTGATAGYVTFRWAQGASGAGGTTVYAESFGRATQVS